MDSTKRIKQFINKAFPEWTKVNFSELEEGIDFKENLSELYRIDNDEIILISYTNISITGSERPKPQLRVFLDEYKKPFDFAKKHQLRYYLFSIFTKEDEMARGLNNFNPKEFIISIETNLDSEGSRRDLRSIYDYANEKIGTRKFLKCSRNDYKADINQASFIYIGTPEHPYKDIFANFVNMFDSRPYLNSNMNSHNLLSDSQPTLKADLPLQTIFFGSPGTGKSFKIKDKILDGVDDNFIFRTTFHPDTDYASFVGCYKPTTISNKTTAHKIIGYEALVEKLREYLERSYVDPKTQKSYKNVNKACVVFGFDHYDSIISMLNEDNDEHSIKSLISEAYGKDNTTYDTPLRAGMTAKETMLENIEQSSRITYDFAPQTFTNAYVKAWKDTTKPVYLVIEEINRGNCAQIFGDLFQLLDRDDNGISEYPIKADADLTKYLQEKLGTNHEGIADGKIKLPSNLSIIATMNTSDQSLFPMDSAFKRRWEWKYVPTSVIGDKKKTLQVESKEETVLLNREQEKKILRLGMYEYDWSVFLEKINKCITDATHSDDKQLGFWFVKTPKDSSLINIETFVSKVIFYLWTDVFKDFGAKATNPFAFKTAEGGMVVCPFSSFFDPYTGEINLGQIHGFMYNLGIIPELEPEIQAAIEKNIVEEGNPEA